MLDIRISHSILRSWKGGDHIGAIKQMFKLDRFITQAMIDGREWHESWSQETAHTGCLPAVFGGKPLVNPICDQKYDVFLVPGIQLVGIPDCHTSTVVHEYKSGAGDVGPYEESGQVDLYGVLLILCGFPVEEGWYHHYNIATGKPTSAKVWLTPDRLNKAQDDIIRMANEMRDYINEHDVEKLINGGSNEEIVS